MYEALRRTIEMGHGATNGWTGQLATRLVRAWQKAEQRRQLAALDDRLLRDSGIRREDALREAAKGYRD